MPTNGQMQFHPYANVFPLMAGNEKSRHEADIAARGLKEDITLYEGKILDGRNRYLACVSTGVKPRFVQFDGDDQAALDFVVANNRQRRHLTSSQAAMCCAEAKKLHSEIASKKKDRSKKESREDTTEPRDFQIEPLGREKAMSDVRSIRIDIDPDLHRRMKIAAARMDTTVTGLARDLMFHALAEIESKSNDLKSPDELRRIVRLSPA